MVNYYFGSKERLFAEAMALIAAPTEVLSRALAHAPKMTPHAQAHHLIETFLGVWEGDGNAERIAEVWLRTMNDPQMKNAVPQFFTDHVLSVLAQHIRGRDASVRAAGVSAVLMGVATSRFLLRLEPLASMPRDQVVRTLTPAVAVYLR